MSSYLPLILAPSFNPLHPVKSIPKNALIPELPSCTPAVGGRLMNSTGPNGKGGENVKGEGRSETGSLSNWGSCSFASQNYSPPHTHFLLEEVIQLSTPGSGNASAPESNSEENRIRSVCILVMESTRTGPTGLPAVIFGIITAARILEY